jgi:DNA damage-binding protein 1
MKIDSLSRGKHKLSAEVNLIDGYYCRARNFVHNDRDAEISAVSCLPQDSTKNFTTKSVVGFWTSNHVEILSLVAADGTMPTIAKTLALSSTPRSLLLYNFTSDGLESNVHPHLLIGLTDGSIASFVYKNDQLLDQKLVSIGSLPVSMRSCRIGTKQTVLACGSRTAILFWEKERLMYSPLILKVGVRFMAHGLVITCS